MPFHLRLLDLDRYRALGKQLDRGRQGDLAALGLVLEGCRSALAGEEFRRWNGATTWFLEAWPRKLDAVSARGHLGMDDQFVEIAIALQGFERTERHAVGHSMFILDSEQLGRLRRSVDRVAPAALNAGAAETLSRLRSLIERAQQSPSYALAVSFTLEEDAAYLQLTPAGTSALRSITEKNRGRMLSVTIEGIPAVTATVVATIDSGRVLIQSPSPKLRERLAEIERAKSAR
jgi:hypothetical protein